MRDMEPEELKAGKGESAEFYIALALILSKHSFSVVSDLEYSVSLTIIIEHTKKQFHVPDALSTELKDSI
ncbi:hypothetical protein NC653_010620 [Populus alba x Populus x berolinensis]|uniref:Uncharacterized protein n=1 Tax=Populus alba x Populus x berolinensis TaxID=444605 RepID=A0AAD6R086_9ROSI|nr:hypothetical protein NC653_010620 [Populus alba x Populus x berolinensis]